MSDLGNKEIFAKNLKYYMNLYNKTRNEICDDLNLSYTTFTSWLNGTNYPRIDKIEMLANYFRINKADLIEDKYKDSAGYYNDPEVAPSQSNYERTRTGAYSSTRRKISLKRISISSLI